LNRNSILIGNANEIPVGESKTFAFTDKSGMVKHGLLIHLEDGFVAYEALCTHLRGDLEYNKITRRIECANRHLHFPGHTYGTFVSRTGRALSARGDSPLKPLNKLEVRAGEEGRIYIVI
jgi:nitrite reductase/ring-hydroxylating ferredoxin subunit